MNLVTLVSAFKQYSDRILLDRVDLLVNSGDRIGLIGINGSGKTTLLRMVAGLEPLDSGERTVWGGVRIQYLPQDPHPAEDQTVLQYLFASDIPQMRLLREYELTSWQLAQAPHDPALHSRLSTLISEMDATGGWAAESNAKAILTRLGIVNFDALVGTLSGGERKRVALARVLLDPGDLLILDEPTNHVDADTIAWLEETLRALPAALLMVTHDRYFLDRVANKIVELDRRKLVSYPGNYTQYLELRTQRDLQLAGEEEKRRAMLKRELDWIRRTPSARGTKQKARTQRVQELIQIRYDLGEERVAIALSSRRLGKKVLKAEGLVKAFNGTPVLDGVDFRLEPGDRVGIMGPNGAGKSTLLNLLAGKLAPDAGIIEWGDTTSLGYYDQQAENLRDDQRVLDFIDNVAPVIRTSDGERIDATQMLDWFLFPRPMQQAPIGTLSGGERRRLYLLATLAQWPNVLFLDEPTNDLDIQTLAVLEAFLDHFTGSLVVVSHDRYFLDRNVDFLLHMEAGRLSGRYPAPYESYRRLREAEQQAKNPSPAASLSREKPKTAPSSGLPASVTPASPSRRRLTWKEQQEFQQLEGQIPRLEAQKAALEALLNQGGADYQRLQTLLAELQQVDKNLEIALSRWMELMELAG